MPSITALQDELGRVGFTVAVLVALTLALWLVASFRRQGAVRLAAVTARVALGVALLGVMSLTLFGWVHPSNAERVLILDPVEGAWGWDSIAWRPVYDNVMLFVPVGALATAVWWRRSPVVVWIGCGLLSVGVEAWQFLVPTGRVANAADLVANATGALLGVLLAIALRVRQAPRRGASERQRQAA